MLEDIPQAGENDPDGIDPFKFAAWMVAAFAFVILLAVMGWPT